jgi:glutaminyl-peptide cyclotransferase
MRLTYPPMRGLATALLAAGLLIGCGGEDGEPDAGGFDANRAFADLEAQVEIGPRPAGSAANRENARLIAERLREAGVEDVVIQRPWRNVVGTIPGTEADAILIAAHHDTKDVPGLVGANDGASGVAVVLELARALPDRLEGPDVNVSLFDAEEARGERPFEEDGTRGSRQYVRYARESERRRRPVQGTPPLRRVESMILFDLVGDCDLQIPREANSDRDLYDYIALQAPGDDSPFGGSTGPILDDHIPFVEAGVRAVDLIDFTYGPGPSPGAWWHTTEDTLDKVCPESLDAVGEAVRAVLPRGPGAKAGITRTETYD